VIYSLSQAEDGFCRRTMSGRVSPSFQGHWTCLSLRRLSMGMLILMSMHSTLMRMMELIERLPAIDGLPSSSSIDAGRSLRAVSAGICLDIMCGLG